MDPSVELTGNGNQVFDDCTGIDRLVSGKELVLLEVQAKCSPSRSLFNLLIPGSRQTVRPHSPMFVSLKSWPSLLSQVSTNMMIEV